MKEPDHNLPWRLDIYQGDNTWRESYSIRDSKDQEFIHDTPMEQQAPYIGDAGYIVQAANNFPRAIELLKSLKDCFYYGEDLLDPEIMQHYKEVLEIAQNEINEFLTKLEEDEK